MSDNKELKFSWIKKEGTKGERLFTFDGERIFNLFRDYPNALNPEQKRIFDEANPFWAKFFRDREYKG